MRQKANKIARIALVAWLALTVITGSTAAAQSSRNQVFNDGSRLYMYLPGLTGNVTTAEAQIGSNVVVDAEVKSLQEIEGAYIHTIILFDNSRSISVGNRDKMKYAAKNIVNKHKQNERITLATFDTSLHELIIESSDYASVLNMIDGIEYINQDTYLKDVLYTAISKYGTDNLIYKQFVVLSDGSDDNDVGYTYDEIKSLFRDKSFRIYTVGSRYESNIGALEEMFSISRATGTASFLLDELEDVNVIGNEISLNSPSSIGFFDLPLDVQDGSRKSVKLTVNTDAGTFDYTAAVDMPFADKSVLETFAAETEAIVVDTGDEEETNVQDTDGPSPASTDQEGGGVVTSEQTPQVQETENITSNNMLETPSDEISGESPVYTEEQISNEDAGIELLDNGTVPSDGIFSVEHDIINTEMIDETESEWGITGFMYSRSPISGISNLVFYIILAAILLIAITVILILLNISRSKNKGKDQHEEKDSIQMDEEDGPTVLLRDDDSTVLWDENSAPTLILIPEGDYSRRIECVCEGEVTIGRKAECKIHITDDKSVSGIHCIVASNGMNGLTIRDNHSSNGTYLNDERVLSEHMLENGDTLEIGRVRYNVQVING